jgi:four helix bundle protein
MDDFTEFDAFQRCRDFTRAVAAHLNAGAFSKDPVLANHLRKTVLSIYSNFAEGFERDGNREFTQFVSITKASVGEARGQLLYAVDFGYLDIEKFQKMNVLGQRATQCLGGLMRFLNTTEMRGRKFKLGGDLVPVPNTNSSDPALATSERRAVQSTRRTPNAKRRAPNDLGQTRNAERS